VTRAAPPAAGRQRGAVLVVSLVMLVVLTLLGVSVMNITQLEERMASNSQEMAQAFQSAETGLSQGFNDDDAWDPATTLSVQDIAVADANANRTNTTSYAVQYLGATNAPSGYDVTKYKRAHFDFRSSGRTPGNAFEMELHGGGTQVCKIEVCN